MGEHLPCKQGVESSNLFISTEIERFLFKTRCLIFRVLPEIYGGIAQLGEHLLCKQGVSGSIPLISTMKSNSFSITA